MRFAIAAAALAAGASAQYGYGSGSDDVTYVTETVDYYTTYCPEATQITHGSQTYTVTEATTLTITNCPGGCTLLRPGSLHPGDPQPVQQLRPCPRPHCQQSWRWCCCHLRSCRSRFVSVFLMGPLRS
ncbi:hypothetical protein K461DRAFT_25795 [Myriangium duriaei CBS 260.36]|uniref:Uncharacterized protein n=1 Tax=Myriangium duriaei CBS 260.36 TaxID=1168546 RepID=A0A9P4J9M7_9PEZI|nr:hypothetical protein K461DRAFT_25795 [Myriangium duriaei CBS 260.36]